jgi:hypothetical protein
MKNDRYSSIQDVIWTSVGVAALIMSILFGSGVGLAIKEIMSEDTQIDKVETSETIDWGKVAEESGLLDREDKSSSQYEEGSIDTNKNLVDENETAKYENY